MASGASSANRSAGSTVLLLGDIVGAPGVSALRDAMPTLRERYQPDLVIANAENAASGSGLTPEIFNKLRDMGVDGCTLGDHAFRKKQIYRTLEESDRLIRPLNLPSKARGKGHMTLKLPDGTPVHVVTLIGRLFMTNMPGGDPFAAIDGVLKRLPQRSIVIVEIHAEATSEKVAMGWHLNGRATAVVGTHTHVQTSDARVLPGDTAGLAGAPGLPSTAYVTDLGMTGPTSSVLGRQVDRVLQFMTTANPTAFDVADGPTAVCGAAIQLDPQSARAWSVETFRVEG